MNASLLLQSYYAFSSSLEVILSDYNLDIVPVASLANATTFYAATPAVFRMGVDPGRRRRSNRRGLASFGDDGDDGDDGALSRAPTHWVVNALAGLDGPVICVVFYVPAQWVTPCSQWAAAEVTCYSLSSRPGSFAFFGDLAFYWPGYETAAPSELDGRVHAPSLTEYVRVEGDASAALTGDAPVAHVALEGLVFAGGDRYCWGDGSTTDNLGGIQHSYATVDAPSALLRLRTTRGVRCSDLARRCPFESVSREGCPPFTTNDAAFETRPCVRNG